MTNLAQRTCIPCQGGIPPLDPSEQAKLLDQLNPGWKVIDHHHLERKYEFTDFKTAMEYTVKVGEMAEDQGHHPDIHLAWGQVKVHIWTHKINGLTVSDFILAARSDALYQPLS